MRKLIFKENRNDHTMRMGH